MPRKPNPPGRNPKKPAGTQKKKQKPKGIFSKPGILGRSLALKKRGATDDEILEYIRKKYFPKHTFEEVKSWYSPKCGKFKRMVTLVRTATPENYKQAYEEIKKITLSHKEASSKRMKALHQDPEFAKANRERIKALHQDPEFAKANRERASKRMKALHQDPEFAKANRERIKALHQDPEFAKANRERIKALHQDPEFAKANRERIKALNQDPEFAKAHRERMKARHKDPKFRAKLVAGIRRYWNAIRLLGEETQLERGIAPAKEYVKEDRVSKKVRIGADTRDPEKALLKKEKGRFLERILKETLDSVETDLLLMRFEGNYTLERICKETGLTEEEVEFAISSAIEKLSKRPELKDILRV